MGHLNYGAPGFRVFARFSHFHDSAPDQNSDLYWNFVELARSARNDERRAWFLLRPCPRRLVPTLTPRSNASRWNAYQDASRPRCAKARPKPRKTNPVPLALALMPLKGGTLEPDFAPLIRFSFLIRDSSYCPIPRIGHPVEARTRQTRMVWLPSIRLSRKSGTSPQKNRADSASLRPCGTIPKFQHQKYSGRCSHLW